MQDGINGRSFGSFGALARSMMAEALQVPARIGAGAEGRPAVAACRQAALDWAGERLGAELPRNAQRHKAFALTGEALACRARRERSPRGDYWTVRIAHDSDADDETAIEIVVADPKRDGKPECAVTIPSWSAEREWPPGMSPAEVLASLAGGAPLLQDGAPIQLSPRLITSQGDLDAFVARLVDAARTMPILVLTQASAGSDTSALIAQAQSLARQFAGLAEVYVLPHQLTYTLSDTITRQLSVYDGAWRLYQPNFRTTSSIHDHPLFLRKRLSEVGGADKAIRDIMSRVGRQHLLYGVRDDMRFAAVTQAGGRKLAARIVGGARKAASRARDMLTALRPQSRPQPAAVEPTPAAAPAPAPIRPVRAAEPEPAAAPTPEAEAEAEAEVSGGAIRRRLRRDLRSARGKARQERQRSETLERERDRAVDEARKAAEALEEARRETRRLAGLVRMDGGDPDRPFPLSWDELPAWAEKTLGGRVVLPAPVRNRLDDAKYEDVAIVASCLNWLGGEYRSRRLAGGAEVRGPLGDVAPGVHNDRCGGDSYGFEWNGRKHRVDWHLKKGGNTRDPRHCLRIYYAWDARRRQVVIASMPNHRRTAVS